MVGGPWLGVAGLLLVAAVLFRDGLLFLIALTVLLAASVARWWRDHCLDGVEYRRELGQRRAFFGEEVELTLEVVNRKLLPLAWLEIQDEVPRELALVVGAAQRSHRPGRAMLVNTLSLRWYERVRRHYRLSCRARGVHVFGPVRLRSGDVFGFDTREVELQRSDQLLVYPRVVPIAQLGLPPRDPFGDRRAHDWLFEDPLNTVGVREYAYGDSPRRIHWKASARAQTLQVKQYEATTSHKLAVFLNLNTMGPSWSVGYEPELLELAIVVAASIATWAVEQDYQVGLSANGYQERSAELVKVPLSRDPDQLTHVLEALARALPFGSLPFEQMLHRDSREMPYGATLVVVAAVVSDAVAAELLALRRAGYRPALLLVGESDAVARLPGVPAYRVGGVSWRELTELRVGGQA